MLLRQQSHYRCLGIATLIVLVSQLPACKVGDNSDGGSSDNLTANSVDVNLNGSVGDGPITGAEVEIYSNRGYLISSATSDSTASYTLNTQAKGYDYPLLLQVSGGDDLVTGDAPDFNLLSVALNPSDKSVNINPFSTLVVRIAQSMTGGVNGSNISAAAAVVSSSFAFGLDPSVIGNPISTKITDANVANIVKASEALGEMVRRTRDSLLAAGTQVSGDEIMASVAADLTDGVFDGAGANGVRPEISAVAKVVSAQVLVEALGNNLKVGGVIATDVIDQAIRITHPGISASRLSGSVRITSDMLTQTHIALAAAEVLDSSPAVQKIISSVDGVTPDVLPTDLETSLPSDASAGLDQAVTLVAFAGDDKIAVINQTVTFSGGGSTTTDGTTVGGTTSGGTTDSGSGSTTTDGTTSGGTTSGGTTGTSDSGTGSTTTDGTTGGGTTSGGTTDTGTTDSGSGSTTTDGTTSGGSTGVDVSNSTPALLSQTNWSVWSVDSEELAREDGIASNAFDGNPATIWHTQWSGASPTTPHELQISLGGRYTISGLRYLPRQDGDDNGRINQYGIYVSTDGANWGAPVASGAFADTDAEQEVLFSPVAATHVRLVALNSYDGDPWTSVAEINLLGDTSSGGTTTDGTTSTGTNDPVTNSAPLISGIPSGLVMVGSDYSFQPVVTDPDGDPLSFSISNKPAWAEFSSSTGQLSGSPGSGSIGMYNDIVIRVRDGAVSANLPAFSIQVAAAPVQTGSINLQWTAPVTRADGTPLSLADIDGYYIYYGLSAQDYSNRLDVTDGSAQSTTITDIPMGTYYIVMTTYDIDGRESAYSTMVTKTTP